MSDRPVLIYDGDCGFCKRWIERWKAWTENLVDYQPYQEAAEFYPEISSEAFKKSVQLVEPGEPRKIYSGAEAVFRSLAYHPKKRWQLWAYQHIPGIKMISEAFYQLVAARRVFFSWVTWIFWGNDLKPSTYRVSGSLFLRLLAIGYGVAFFSLSTQILGLVGQDGINPASLFLQQAAERYGEKAHWIIPTLVWFHKSDFFLLFLCYGGMFLSFLLFAGVLPVLSLFLIWLFYLSLASAGQEFLMFQWDSLLLEAGFLAIFFSPLTVWERFAKFDFFGAPHFLLKWLLFRLMFLSGVVKLASGDPAWQDLTALSFHYETQPLPPWTAWFVHHLPQGFHQFSTAVMFVIELLVPFMFFLPRRLRHFACFATMSLHFMIMVTGNYCFFNLLSMGLCLLLLDDSFWRWIPLIGKTTPEFEKTVFYSRRPRRFTAWVTYPLATLVLFVSLSQMSWIWEGGKRHLRSVGNLERVLGPFRSINSYGLFAVMTKERDEIILEGSADGVEWKTYEFKYKPGDISKKPAFVQPLQPRLDWQMWFAALGSFRQNPWFINFCVRLLGGSKEVKKLLAADPFPEKPPVYLKATLYRYKFSTPAQKKNYKVWWMREEKQSYCPVMSLK